MEGVMREAAELLKSRIKEGKVICEFTGDCYICYLKKGSDWFIVAISHGKSLYAKIVPYGKFPIIENCEGVLVAPNGLFAFGENEEKLVEEILKKLEIIKK
ncbi:hypothetical protein IPA_06285 [Ignicoccus pacificus DSM 13166]|uniref:Uncharacterized protein n=1 Tax=Ignicoccus pacificus DSM 13166 TaxID=940294 RepID=A0A977KBI6_9CREN|nr:hypothetical protein IPA_06285 [Ignicoccus pacificus DSM 13166]